MSSVETGQVSAVETGQMTAAETSVLSQQKTSVLSQQQTSNIVNQNWGLSKPCMVLSLSFVGGCMSVFSCCDCGNYWGVLLLLVMNSRLPLDQFVGSVADNNDTYRMI